MIIVKTKNGDHFVNDSALIEVAHDKEKAIVFCYRNNGCITTITDVESVVYTNADQTVKYEDKESRVAEMEANLHELSKWGNNMRDKYMELDKENGELKEEVKKLKNRIETEKDLKTPPQKISLRATSPMGSDCTQAFDVDGCDGMMASAFIMAVIKNDPYVEIDFNCNGYKIWHCWYKDQKMVDQVKNIPEDFHLMKVKSAKACGGYGQISYRVELHSLGE